MNGCACLKIAVVRDLVWLAGRDQAVDAHRGHPLTLPHHGNSQGVTEFLPSLSLRPMLFSSTHPPPKLNSFEEKKKMLIRKDDLSDDDSDSSDEEMELEYCPWFLVVESEDESKILSKLSPFAIDKGIAGELKSIKRLRRNVFLVEAANKRQSVALRKARIFIDRPLKVTPHQTLNSSKGVIRCKDLIDTPEVEIKRRLKKQGVTDIYKCKVKRDGKDIVTGTMFVTFRFPVLPEFLIVGWMRVKVAQYIPSPMRCFRCQKYGHTRMRCAEQYEACADCSLVRHDGPCSRPRLCVNCDGAHSAASKECPRWIFESYIQEVKVKERLPFFEAKKVAETRRPMLKVNKSYASAVKNVSVNASTQTEAPVMAPCGSLAPPVVSQPPSQGGTKRRAPVEDKVVQNKRPLGKVANPKPSQSTEKPRPSNKYSNTTTNTNHSVAPQSANPASKDAPSALKDAKPASKDAKIKPGGTTRTPLDASASRVPSAPPGEKAKSSVGSGVAPASSKGGAATDSGRTSGKSGPPSGRAKKGDQSFNLFQALDVEEEEEEDMESSSFYDQPKWQ